jgi:hypothetical protein
MGFFDGDDDFSFGTGDDGQGWIPQPDPNQFDWSQYEQNGIDPSQFNYSAFLGDTIDPKDYIGGNLQQGPSFGQQAGSVLKRVLTDPNTARRIGATIGGFGEGQKSNRVVQGQQTQGYDVLKLKAAENRRADESDALHKLAITNYLSHGGSHYKPPTIQLNGKSYTAPTLGSEPLPASAAQMQGASTLEGQMLKRLQPGGSYEPQSLGDYATPGLAEKISNYAAPILTGIGQYEQGKQPDGGQDPYIQSIIDELMKKQQQPGNI